MSININSGGDKTCLFCYCVTYDFRQTENDVPLHQIITTCNKHLPQEVIGSTTWENVISATENFCQDCHNLAIQLVTLNADLDRISKEIEVLSTHFSNRIVSGKRNYELLTESTTIFHNDSLEDSNGDNISDLYNANSPNSTENDGNSGNLNTQGSPTIYNAVTDFHNNSKSNYEATAQSVRVHKRVNESSLKNTNKKRRVLKRKRPEKVKNVDPTTGSTGLVSSAIVIGSDLQHHIDNDIASGYQCEKCNKRFSRLTILQKHDCSKRTFECEVCNKSFSGTGVLKLHMRCHTGEKPFKCDTCGKSFAVRCHLNTHLRFHSEERPFKCNICDKTFKDDSNLKSHIGIHNKSEKMYKCDICSKALSCLVSLKKHLMTHKEERPHQCVTCGKRYNIKESLRKHELSHLKEKPFKCELCEKSFTRRYRLTCHAETHSTDRGLLCEECGKSFSTSKYLAIHTLTHTEKGPFVCENCGKKYPSSVRLKSHIRYYHSEKTIKCESCNSVFKTQPSFVKHQKSLDCQSGPPFMCNQCDKSFNRKTNRQRHIIIEHLSENERPKFHCDVCKEVFHMKSDLAWHKRQNRCHLFGVSKVNGVVFCETCKMYLKNEAKFQRHLQNSTKVIKCNFCPEKLRTKCEYNIHSQKFHPNGESFYKCKICNVPCPSKRFLRIHEKSSHQNESSVKEDSDHEVAIPSFCSMGTRSTRGKNKMETETESLSEGEDKGCNAVDEEGKWNAKNQIDDSEDENIEIKVEDVGFEIKIENDEYIMDT